MCTSCSRVIVDGRFITQGLSRVDLHCSWGRVASLINIRIDHVRCVRLGCLCMLGVVLNISYCHALSQVNVSPN